MKLSYKKVMEIGAELTANDAIGMGHTSEENGGNSPMMMLITVMFDKVATVKLLEALEITEESGEVEVSREQYRKAVSKVIDKIGEEAKEGEGDNMRFLTQMLASVSFLHDLEKALFGEESEEGGEVDAEKADD